MSMSAFLYCPEAKHAVHVAEASSGWFRGANHPAAVAAFCCAHKGKALLTAFRTSSTTRSRRDANAPGAYAARVGRELPGYAQPGRR